MCWGQKSAPRGSLAGRCLPAVVTATLLPGESRGLVASLRNHPWWALGRGVAQGGKEAGELNFWPRSPLSRGQRTKGKEPGLQSGLSPSSGAIRRHYLDIVRTVQPP